MLCFPLSRWRYRACIDCRPGDAIAMTIHYSQILPIHVAEQVLNKAG
ncbi:MAG TPA: DUF151 domain-containing protein [Planctomycetaceae bacterium]|nr:DUF151 domain-containing protein [Planctomycetaceae bacterium]